MTTVPKTTDNERIPRRQAFAEFLLFGNPTKLRQDDIEPDTLVVHVDSLDELERWCARFLPGHKASVCQVDSGEVDRLAYANGKWAGWTLKLRAVWPIVPPVAELDAETRAELEQVR